MKPGNDSNLNIQIYEQASAWFVEFRSGDLDTAERRRFHAWLLTSPEHMRAYLELAAIWNEGTRLDPSHRYDDETLLAEAMSEANVVHPETFMHRGARFSKPERRVGRSASLCALAASILMAITGLGAWYYTQLGVYETTIGEQRAITLSDGSQIELNTNSRVRERFDATERRVELLSGQALFLVAKDKGRPFVVASGDASVRAVGTQFDVYRKATGTTVTVVEGTVALRAAGRDRGVPPEARDNRPVVGVDPGRTADASSMPVLAADGEILLAAGEQAIVTAHATMKPVNPNVVAVTAWTRKRLIFESATLADVAEEFNRYNSQRLVIQSPELAEFRITGTFSSADPAALIRFLRARPGIVVSEEKGNILVTQAR